MSWRQWIALTVLFVMVISSLGRAESNDICDGALSAAAAESSPTEIMNKAMAEKYPDLAFVLQDPDQFMAEMRRRFDARKIENPKDPHSFDFSEIGMDGVRYADEALTKKMSKLIDARTRYEQVINNPTLKDRIFMSKNRQNLEDINTALLFWADLQTEARNILERGNIGYRQTVEFLYFFSRAIGYFDTKDFSLYTRFLLNIDRKFQGYEPLPIAEEYNMYKRRKFFVFQKASTVLGFTKAALSFELAFENKHHLETIFIPSPAAIDRDVLMRLMNREINLIGVTADPIAADGFLRPGGDFWIHDVRHESSKFRRRLIYKRIKLASDEQMAQLDTLQEQIMLELYQGIEGIKNKQLKEAVSLVAFNFNHDRGFPLLPSAWLSRKNTHVTYGLIFALAVSGQGTGYHLPITYTTLAHKWLSKFWQERIEREEQILKEEDLDL